MRITKRYRVDQAPEVEAWAKRGNGFILGGIHGTEGLLAEFLEGAWRLPETAGTGTDLEGGLGGKVNTMLVDWR